MNKYREKLYEIEYDASEVTEGDIYINKDSVQDIIDEIENCVNEILDQLNTIQGLTEIEDIKELVKKLSRDLY